MASRRHPNILFIVTDDQPVGTLSAMPETVRLFQRGGVRFTNAFATTPVCCPSRASILTGRYAHNHGVHDNFTADELDQLSTLQRYLQEAGYRTATFGKFLNNWDLERTPPFFNDWAIFTRSRESYQGGEWSVHGDLRTVQTYGTSFVEQHALRFLSASEDEDDRPWFMFLTPPAPHNPYVPEPRYAHAAVPRWKPNPAVRERDRSDKPSFLQDYSFPLADARRIRAEQLRTLRSVDDMVEELFERARRLGEDDHLAAFFLSDNGYIWGEHGLGGEIRGKGIPYLDAVRIPFFVRWPERFPTGTRDDRLVATIDIVPTLMDALRLSPDERYPLDGRSLFRDRWRHRLLLESWRNQTFVGLPTWAATLTKRFQYVEYYSEDRSAPIAREYYDLRKDPWELRNLLGNESTRDDVRTGALSRRLAEDRICQGDDCP